MTNEHTKPMQPEHSATSHSHPQLEAAIDHLLGQMSKAEREIFEEKLASSPAMQRNYAALDDIINKLHLLSPERKPPAYVWDMIQAKIRTPVREMASPQQVETKHTGSGWVPWLLGSNAVLVSALLGTVIYFGMFQPKQKLDTMPYTAVLQTENAEPMWMVKADRSMGKLVINNTKPLSMPSDHSDEKCLLWVQTEDGALAISKVPVDGSSMSLELSKSQQETLKNGGKIFITREFMPESGHDMPETPSQNVESAGKFVSEPEIL